MSNQIITSIEDEVTKVAILEDDELVEFFYEKTDSGKLTGNIYRGKISNVLPGMYAAFVDIGYEKNAFLFVEDAIPQKEFVGETEVEKHKATNIRIEDVVSVGQEITVQVIKEPIGTKGPRVTTNITLPGRNIVLLPNTDFIGISRRIKQTEQREKLRDIVNKIKPHNMGLIIRTASESSEQSIEQDINFLIKLWESIKSQEQKGKVPRCLHRDLSLIYRCVRDLLSIDVDKFMINNLDVYYKVIEMVDMISPDLKNKLMYFSKDIDILEHYGVNFQILKALSEKVWLKNGGYIIIQETEALTVVDVNTGKYVGKKNFEDTVLKINEEAAREIAKQIRLRNIGGIIIIDFIDMSNNENKDIVINTLREALKNDRTRTVVVGMTGLGLVEMTRKKVGYSLSTMGIVKGV